MVFSLEKLELDHSKLLPQQDSSQDSSFCLKFFSFKGSSDWEEIENVCCVCVYMFGRTTIQSGRCWFVRTAVKHTYKHTNICLIVWQTD